MDKFFVMTIFEIYEKIIGCFERDLTLNGFF